jgi:hypothetical protein
VGLGVDVLGMKGKKVKNYDNDGFSTSSHAFLWGEREVTLGIAKLNSFFTFFVTSGRVSLES